MVKMLRPWNQLIEIEGSLSYVEKLGSWAVLRLRKAILNEFPQLRQRSDQTYYKMLFYKDYAALLAELEKIKEEKGPLPILLYFYQE